MRRRPTRSPLFCGKAEKNFEKRLDKGFVIQYNSNVVKCIDEERGFCVFSERRRAVRDAMAGILTRLGAVFSKMRAVRLCVSRGGRSAAVIGQSGVRENAI